MRIAVLGSTGRTGRRVVEQALARGYAVTALARRPEDVALESPDLNVCRAEAQNPESVIAALAGCDAVVSALGVGMSRGATTVYSAGITNVLAGMATHRVKTVAVVSAAPVGDRADQPFVERRVMMPLLGRFFGASYDDMRRMEALLSSSSVAWISLRPPRLLDKPATGTYRIQADRPLRKARSLIYADLATALLDSLQRSELHCRACYVAN